jgi:hypothetical protein
MSYNKTTLRVALKRNALYFAVTHSKWVFKCFYYLANLRFPIELCFNFKRYLTCFPNVDICANSFFNDVLKLQSPQELLRLLYFFF